MVGERRAQAFCTSICVFFSIARALFWHSTMEKPTTTTLDGEKSSRCFCQFFRCCSLVLNQFIFTLARADNEFELRLNFFRMLPPLSLFIRLFRLHKVHIHFIFEQRQKFPLELECCSCSTLACPC